MEQQYASSDINHHSVQSQEHISFDQDDRYHKIAETAYFIAEQRGFQGGDPVEDWLQAEATVDSFEQESHTEQ